MEAMIRELMSMQEIGGESAAYISIKSQQTRLALDSPATGMRCWQGVDAKADVVS